MSEDKPRGKLVTPLSTYPTAEVDYLWPLYFALRKLHLLVGDPNVGKSYVILAILAALLRGRLPYIEGEPQRVSPVGEMSALYLTRENDPHDTIRPRFELLGGPPDRLFVFPLPSLDEDPGPAITMIDLNLLKVAVQEAEATGAPPVKAIVFDPMQSFLPAGVDLHRSNETRPALDRLRAFLAQHEMAGILVAHLNKGSGKAMYRTLGSIDIVGAARSVIHAADIEGRKVLIQTKAIEAHGRSIAYEIDEHGLRFTGHVNLTQHDLDTTRPAEDTSNKTEEAKGVILEQLAVAPLDIQRLESTVRSVLDCSARTVRRAREELKGEGVLDWRRFGNGKAYWYRLDHAEPDWSAFQ